LTKLITPLIILALVLSLANIGLLWTDNINQNNQIENLQQEINILKSIIHFQGKRLDYLNQIQAMGGSQEVAKLILENSFRFNIPPLMLARLVKVESNFDLQAVNKRTGATGLMQITPATAKLYGFSLTHEPEANIYQGVYIFSDKLKQYGSIEKALASYHGGHERAKNWGKVNYPQGATKDYVKEILGGVK